MTVTLLITVLVEGIFVVAYCVWQKQTMQPLLLTSICINLITQSLLWVTLNLLYKYYLSALIVAELAIWIIEGVALYSVPANRLLLSKALLLSLGMNLVSFGIGWFLPV